MLVVVGGLGPVNLRHNRVLMNTVDKLWRIAARNGLVVRSHHSRRNLLALQSEKSTLKSTN